MKRVLVFYELGPSSPGLGPLDQELHAGLSNSQCEIELYHEYFESIRFPDPVIQQEIREWFVRKYRDRRPDLIIALGPSPIKFLIESHEKFFTDIPIVFGGATKAEADNSKLDAHFTGVWEQFEPGRTLEGALRLQPDTRHVVVVGGMSTFDRRVEALSKDQLRSYENKLDITYLTDLDMPTLLERLKHLPPNTVVLYTHLELDARGTQFVGLSQAVPLITAAANAPVFSPSDMDLGYGEVGGYLESLPAEGRIVGQFAARILNGEKPQDIPIEITADAYTFDWRALHHWGLKEKNLPAGSVVLYREPTFWEAYRWYIAFAILLLLAQTTILAALLWHWTRGRKSRQALAIANERLRLAMETAKAVSWHKDLKAGLTTWTGGLLHIFGVSAGTFSMRTGELVRYVHPEDRERISRELNFSKERREPFAAEFRIVGTDDVTRWYSARGRYDYLPNGIATRMLGMAIDITDRKRAEEATQKSEEKFSKAFRESPVAFTLTSAMDNRYIEVNETFEYATGWRRDEVIGRTPNDIRVWVDPEGRTQYVTRLLTEGNVRNLEVSFRTKDGEVRTGLGSGELIEVQGEQCVLSAIIDITGFKRAEEQRRISEQKFRQFFETLPEYSYIVSLAGEILDINPAACQALGYSKEELIGRPLSSVYAPESHSKIIDLLQKWMQTGNLRNEEMVVLTKDGKKRSVLLNAGVMKDAKGNILHSAAVQLDISEYKEVQQQLRESQDRLESIVTSAIDAIIATDSEQNIVVFNAAAEAMFGCPAQEAILTSIDRFVPERFRSAHREPMHLFGATGVPDRTTGVLGSSWGLKSNGVEFPIETSISQVGADDKKLFVVIIRDVTERKLAEDALSNVSRRLIEAHEEERTWLARELHDDINQRLALMAVTLGAVQRALPQEATEAGQSIGEIRKQIADLGNDVQALSHRLYSSKLEYLGLTAAASAFCQELSELQDVKIDFQYEPIPNTLPMEISLCLFRVLQEALQNATKHSGSREFQVSLTCGSGKIHLIVRDSGIGFDAEEIMKGRGIGIASMRERLKLVDGMLSIDSHVQKGTEVHASVPFHPFSKAARAGKT